MELAGAFFNRVKRSEGVFNVLSEIHGGVASPNLGPSPHVADGHDRTVGS